MSCRFRIFILLLPVTSMPVVQSVLESSRKEDKFIKDARASFDVREKRAISRIVIGMAAVRKLTLNSLAIPLKSQVYRRYEKPGDFETAVRDFFSVKPTNVKDHKFSQSGFSNVVPSGRTISGNVGNRRLLLKERGETGRPTIEVIETKLEPGPYIDEIVYKNVGA